jgi:hypothetical protein
MDPQIPKSSIETTERISEVTLESVMIVMKREVLNFSIARIYKTVYLHEE